MTVSLADVQNAIKDGIVSIGALRGSSGEINTGATVWSDEPRPAPKVVHILDIVSMVAIQDRECNVYNEDTLEWDWHLSTLYYIRVQVRAESVFNHPDSDALLSLERVRGGLRRPDLVWDAGVINQPDDATYVHHVSFPHDGHIINSYSFETGFRAVVDSPLSGIVPAAPNMQQVLIDEGFVEVGEDAPHEMTADIQRPIEIDP